MRPSRPNGLKIDVLKIDLQLFFEAATVATSVGQLVPFEAWKIFSERGSVMI